ncbi:flagellar biosynthetic protein FliO [Alkalihalobacillus oceani]|uniref:flagellar biosynthetic protein FliO n=1 Tax=Halalkalibacter oceani TaxID=1653776 RepID=UPI00203F5B9E|nr:flagellar biosynthetic protein FliO [Halalkalibacter oceani]MCM3759460.1 flagellar biosynthetic protein FliO [Halalkalibacter oceani]
MQQRRIIAFVILLLLTCLQPAFALAEQPDENRTVTESLQQPETEAAEEEAGTAESEVETVISESEPNAEFSEPNTFLMFVQMIAALSFVVLLMYVLLRFFSKRSQAFQSNQMLQNIGGVPLGANRSVQVVKVGNRLLVVGVGETIQLLKEIDNEDEMKQLLMQREEQFAQLNQPFNRLVSTIKGRGKQAPATAETNRDAFKQLLAKQLQDVSHSQDKLHDAVRERDKT